MDYEKEYKELKRKVDQVYVPLINAAMHLLEDDPDDFCEKYKDRIAPDHLDLPSIMTACEPDEREVLIKRCRARVEDGMWKGTTQRHRKGRHGGRAQFGMQTRYFKNRKQQGRATTTTSMFPPAHAFLVDSGRYPTERKNVASHLCHTPLCMNPDHLEWSSAGDNLRREMCRREGRCICRLDPPCIFGVH